MRFRAIDQSRLHAEYGGYLPRWPTGPRETGIMIGTPRFEKTDLDLAEGTLVIEAKGAGPANFYVSGVRLNGKELSTPWLSRPEIGRGGSLQFDLSNKPSGWGAVR